MNVAANDRALFRNLVLTAVLVGVGIAVVTYKVFEPYLQTHPAEATEAKVAVPAYDYQTFASLPVQMNGRVMPFRTAAEEIVRNVCGRARLQGNDPVAIVLQWVVLKGSGGKSFTDWERFPFILCDHHDLRKIIYQGFVDAQGRKFRGFLAQDETPTQEQLHGKYVSPNELRNSEAYKRVVEQTEEIMRDDQEKASQLMSAEQRKAQEVAGRLVEYDSVSQDTVGNGPGPRHHDCPIHLVALDQVRGGGWFSLDEVQDCLRDEMTRAQFTSEQRKQMDESRWQFIMKDRLADSPQLYIKPEAAEALREFQEHVKNGTAAELLDRLAEKMRQARDKKAAQLDKAVKTANDTALGSLAERIARTSEERQRLGELVHESTASQDQIRVGLAAELKAILARRDDDAIKQLNLRLPKAGDKYHPADLRFRMLHLDYLENLFPNLYRESDAWQPFPVESARRVLGSFEKLQAGYQSGDPPTFQTASLAFFETLRDISQEVAPYPGDDTIGTRLVGLVGGPAPGQAGAQLLDLEARFDRVQPFRWGWVLMLLSLIFFGISLATDTRTCYRLGFAAYLASLGFQLFGFFARIVIAGRPPVSNMYETVIWVSFMSAFFGLILELIYWRKVIGLAAAMVSTLGLVLADQLPLVLDPKISPLVPVLRSNYWLTIHVLTIVSSYAAGTLAWGLGNVSLALMAFGSYRRDTLQMLSRFTYRAIQIAVLLLAAGTFLGGWWAAESWGRFWGWDPKETWALIALVCYVIPLHMRYIGWVKDFGLAVSAVVCYAAIVMSWYGVNFVLGAGLHSYGFGGGGPWWVFWAGLLNIEWVLIGSMLYLRKRSAETIEATVPEPQVS